MTGKLCCEKSKQTGETKEQSLATPRAAGFTEHQFTGARLSPAAWVYSCYVKTSRFRAQLPADFFKCSVGSEV